MICSNALNCFRGEPKFDPLLQMERNYCSNRPAHKNTFLRAGRGDPPLLIIFKFISETHLIQKIALLAVRP